MNLLLIPLFAICNRCRGNKGWLPPIGKAGAMIVLFCLLWPSWILGLLAAALYLFGQSLGWGWWIGPIIGSPNKKKVDGFRELISHDIAKNIFTESSLWYCRLALVIIGLWWWLPVLACFSLGWSTIFAAGICSVGFPLAFEISKKWDIGEIVYGAFQGLAIYLIV